jgi:Na+/H+ antiporter NhaD/arsenite permease-like protein
VVVTGVVRAASGWIGRLAPLFLRNTVTLSGLSRFAARSTLGSNLFSNVPFVVLQRPWAASVPNARLPWLALSASSTLAGNLTLMGSIANLIVAPGAREACPLGFWR